VALQAIVFDFDGVIANTEPLHFRAFRDVLAARGIALAEADYYDRYLGFDDVGVFRAVAAEHAVTWSIDDLADLTMRKATRVEALERDGSLLFPGAAEAIRRSAAVVPLAIASGALGNEIRRVLDGAALTSAFRVIVSAEDTPASKPAPDPYVRAVTLLSERVGTRLWPGSCVAIEDSRWGIASAKAAGLKTVAVTHTYERRELGEADLIVSSLDDLGVAVLRQLCPG
jgi:beta-phosphoglucomutase-like phosphatase (HAD superfamily)